jgi:hypothetical protein
MMSEIGDASQSARRTSSSTRMPDFAYRIVSLMHDNPILPIFRRLGWIFLFTKGVTGGNNHG